MCCSHISTCLSRSWFVCVCRALHLELQYVDAIRHVLLLGGDTDTNAGVHGLPGMMPVAALVGAVRWPVRAQEVTP